MGSPLQILNDSEVEAIKHGSMQILSEVGLQINHPDILKRLRDAGLETSNSNVLFKEKIVEEAIEKSTKRYTIHARNSTKSVNVGSGELRFLSSGGQRWLVDPIRKVRRRPICADVADAVRLGDGLDNINIVGALVAPEDLPVPGRAVYVYSELLKNSSKVVFSWLEHPDEARGVIRLFELLAGGTEALREKPLMWYFCEPASPLRFTHESLEILRLFCEKGLPVSIGPMVQAGLSGPVTLAGTVVQTNAEILAGVTIAQILSPGNPVEYGGVCHLADMRSGDISFGSPEQGLLAAAMAQIGCSYGFAVHVNTGLTDAIVPDAQSGIEKATTMAVSAMAGAEMFGHLGIAGADQGASLEQLVIDNEIAGYVKRLLKGIRVTDETLAVDVIRQTRSKSYLSTLHTTKHVRSEQWFPTILNRARWEDWIGKNGKDLLSIARDKKEKILAEHKPEPLDARVQAKIDAVVKQYAH